MSINIKNLLLNENSFGLGKEQIISNHLYSHMHSRRTTVAHTQVYAGLDTYLYQSKFKKFCKKFMSINIKNLLLNENSFGLGKKQIISNHLYSHMHSRRTTVAHTQVYAGLDTYLYQSKFKKFCKKFMSINIKNLLLNENSFGPGKKQIISNHLYSHMHLRRTTVAHTQVYAGLDTYLYQSKFKTFCKKFMSINIKYLLLNENSFGLGKKQIISNHLYSHMHSRRTTVAHIHKCMLV